VLAVEERKGRSGGPGLPKLRQTGPRTEQRTTAEGCCGPTRLFTALRLRCPSWSILFPRPFPKSAQRQQTSVRGYLTSVLYTHNIFPVKSFVDSGNNGLDGVCIAFGPQSTLN
jgi:hypothetical protein